MGWIVFERHISGADFLLHFNSIMKFLESGRNTSNLANRSEIKLAFHYIEGSLLPFPHRTKSKNLSLKVPLLLPSLISLYKFSA